jgi:hypothetical protein
MTLRVYFPDEIQNVILAGMINTLQIAKACGAKLEHLAWALMAYQHQARSFGLDWGRIVGAARVALGAGYDDLLGVGAQRAIEG